MSEQSDRLRADAWQVALSLGQFTCLDLVIATKRGNEWCRKVIRAWRDDGRLVQSGKDDVGRHMYHTVPDWMPDEASFGGERKTPEFAIWRTMRMLRQFSPGDILMTANTEAVPLTRQQIAVYCSDLCEAGMIECIRKQRFGAGESRYRIVGKPGPLPPKVKRVPAVIDQNTGDVRVLNRRVSL